MTCVQGKWEMVQNLFSALMESLEVDWAKKTHLTNYNNSSNNNNDTV